MQTTVYNKPTYSLYISKTILVTIYPVLVIQKGVALRLRRICLTDEEDNSK